MTSALPKSKRRRRGCRSVAIQIFSRIAHVRLRGASRAASRSCCCCRRRAKSPRLRPRLPPREEERD
eukprot:8857669-Pyramimonas_sp.AAC.1